MSELVIGLGLVLVIEGLLWAVFPSIAYRLMQVASQTPEQRLRLWGVITLGLGVALIWLVKG